MKRLKYYWLTIFAILAFLLAACVGCIRLFLIPMLAGDSLWALKRFYGPNKPPNLTYNDLYDYAMQNIQDRNSQVAFYQSIICVLLILFGVLFLLWSRDVKNVSKRIKGNESQAGNVRNS